MQIESQRPSFHLGHFLKEFTYTSIQAQGKLFFHLGKNDD